VCEELRRRRVDVCCIQEVRWRGKSARFMGVRGRRYKLWWSGNDEGQGGVGILIKEELCEKVIEVRRKSDRIMALVLIFEEEVLRLICAYAPQRGRPEVEKDSFYDEMAGEWNVGGAKEIVIGLGDFNGHIGKEADGFEGVHGGNGIGKRNMEGKRLLEFCEEKELCVMNTWYRKNEKRKVTFSSGGNQSEIDFVLIGKENRKYVRDVKSIPGELQHRLVVADMDKKKVRKVIRKERTVKRKVWMLKDDNMREKFEEKSEELVDVNAKNLWKSFRDGLLQACDEVCGRKIRRRDQGDTWWWNKDVKEAILNKKAAYKELCKNDNGNNKAIYKKMKKQAKNVIRKAMRKEAELQMEGLRSDPNKIFRLVKSTKRDGKDCVGVRCIKDEGGSHDSNGFSRRSD